MLNKKPASGFPRRAFLLGTGAALCSNRAALALGRRPAGGSLRLRVPLTMDWMTPDRDDLSGRLVASSLFESCFVFSSLAPAASSGKPPKESTSSFRLSVVDGGPSVSRFEVAIERAKKGALGPYLQAFGKVKRDSGGLVGTSDLPPQTIEAVLRRILVSSDSTHNGTGPFEQLAEKGGLVLRRNPKARVTPSLLDEVTLSTCSDIAESLRDFERKATDIAFGGRGLYEPRKDAVLGYSGSLGTLVFRPMKKPWDVPGAGQRVCNGLDATSFDALGISLGTWSKESPVRWSGDPGTLVYRQQGPWFDAFARTLASLISSVGHEVTALGVSGTSFSEAIKESNVIGTLDVVRPLSSSPLDHLVALASLDSPTRAAETLKKAPKIGTKSFRELGLGTQAGVIGECIFRLGLSSSVSISSTDSEPIDFGSCYRNAGGSP